MFRWNAHPEIDSPAGRAQTEEGIYVDELDDGAVVEIETAHSLYKLVKRDDTHVAISGHPRFCPQPVEVEIEGSVGDKSPAFSNPGFIGRGMHLVYKHPEFNIITTSQIREIHTRR
jgi:hypothetical protein